MKQYAEAAQERKSQERSLHIYQDAQQLYRLQRIRNVYSSVFRKYRSAGACNLGTSFGMGLSVTTFMIAQGKQFITPALLGNVARYYRVGYRLARLML